jgi:hypothetical protein
MAKEESSFEVVEKGPLFKKSESTAIRLNLVRINGTEMYDLRQYYRGKGDKEWKPTPKGITIPLDKGIKLFSKGKRFVKTVNDSRNKDGDDNE